MVIELIRWVLFPFCAGISGIYAVAMAKPQHRPKQALKRGLVRYPTVRPFTVQGSDHREPPRHLVVGSR